MFDFFLFGFYASDISRAYFPAQSHTASLLQTFATFGAGFLMRPLGAVLLGAYIDRVGRQQGLVVTLIFMAVGTLVIAVVPGHATIGMAATVTVVAGRLVQGFAAGAELGSVSVYLAELAPSHQRGFYVSFQSSSQQVAVMMAAGLGCLLNSFLPKETMAAWGWRVPFLVGCTLIPLIFYMRQSLEETAVFLNAKHRPTLPHVLRSLWDNGLLITGGMLLVVLTTVCFYLTTVYTPTYGTDVLQLTPRESLLVTVVVGASNMLWLPVMGALSDRIGRRPQLFVGALLVLLTSRPALNQLTAHPTLITMLLVECWLSFLFATYNGALVVALFELMPADIRTTGFSLAYSLATAVFGGFTPMISMYLIAKTNDRAAPAFWLCAAAVLSLMGLALLGCRPATISTSGLG